MPPVLPQKSASVLVVDDDAFIRRTLDDVLKAAGFRTLEAANGAQALTVYRQRRPDLVLLDLVMPDMDGFSVCEALRRLPEGRHVPVLMVTGLNETRHIHRAFEVGATDFISKPIDYELIAYRIRYMLRAADTMGALRKSEERLAHAQRIAHLGHWEWDVETDRLLLSDEIFRIVELPPARFDQTLESFLAFVHPREREAMGAELRALPTNGGTIYREQEFVTGGGSRRVLVHGEYSDEGEKSPRVFGTIQDITERKKSEETLLILKQAVDCLPIGITVTDNKGSILFTNPAEATIHGFTREELLHSDARTLAPPHLRKPIPMEKFRNLSYWKRESINIRRDGAEFPVQLTSIPVRNGEDECIGFITACEDITERKATEKKIEQLAFYDMLTGLPNRRMFMDRLGQALAVAERGSWQTAVLFLDLDRFKDINDGFGHLFGDNLLRAVARRLQQCMRKADTIARLGGDEFVVLLSDVGQKRNAAYAARRILESFARPFELEDRRVHTSVSIGIALYPEDGSHVEKLLQCADTAMYHAKSQGKRTYRFFSQKLNRRMQERLSLEVDLTRALEGQELHLNYQPQTEFASRRLVGVEALIRWLCPKRGLIEPTTIIDVAEDTGLIHRLGDWVLRTACAQLKTWHQNGYDIPKIAVNISGRQFEQPDFLDMVDRALEESGLAPSFLELELTESVIMEKAEKTVSTLKALKARGILLSIDDFGTGYSSLSYLKHFPIDRIKIDRSFVLDVTRSRDDAAIVEAIIAMAHRLNLKVVAEGVETADQSAFLKARGCDEAQGYYFSKPVPAGSLLQTPCCVDLPPDIVDSTFSTSRLG